MSGVINGAGRKRYHTGPLVPLLRHLCWQSAALLAPCPSWMASVVPRAAVMTLLVFYLLSLVSLPGRKVSSLVQLGCEHSPPVAIHWALMSLVMATWTQPAMLLVHLPVSALSEPFPAAAGGPYQLRGSSTVPGGRAASTGTLPTGLWGETGWWGITGDPMVLGDHSSAVGWSGIQASRPELEVLGEGTRHSTNISPSPWQSLLPSISRRWLEALLAQQLYLWCRVE